MPHDKVAERSIRGQYEGYRQEVNNPTSMVETYAALKLYVQNGRWENTPITIRTGKSLDERSTTIDLRFIHPKGNTKHPNIVTIAIQPREGISIDLYVKRPGYNQEMQLVPMDFRYERNFDSGNHPNAYERVLVDAIRGDRTLFATGDEVIASWRILQPVIEDWAKNEPDIQLYQPGSPGPVLTNEFSKVITKP
jgi:glucose-6-phosphate 1-dehydrogenase